MPTSSADRFPNCSTASTRRHEAHRRPPPLTITADAVLAQLADAGIGSGDPVGLAASTGSGAGIAFGDHRVALVPSAATAIVASVDLALSPRWTWWDRATADWVAENDLAIDRCWDVLTVHRLLRGGWRTSVAEVWAWLHDLAIDDLPKMGQLGLLDAPSDEGTDPEQPIRPDGHLRPEWTDTGWAQSPERLATWAGLALDAAELQRSHVARRPAPERAISTAHSESVAELLCAELARDGLPVDMATALQIIGDAAGPRPDNMADEEAIRAERDRAVTDQLTPPRPVNLRNPADVQSMLRSVGVDLPDTRAWRLEQARDAHPVVEALLTWRKAERIATTYGYRWLDESVSGGRLRGDWTGSDGAAGRMTASAGLHNLPAEMRPAIAAEPGFRFVRADLGQIEPRVLAAVSGDPALIAATADADLYQPVAKRLGVERGIAKLAVLGAMYGATTGESAGALHGLQKEYPIAMGLLDDAAAEGKLGNAISTVGGRRVAMWVDPNVEGDIERARSVAAARGRFARNALIQGAAAEFFKVWAIIVRRRLRGLGATVVLCLHDELLVHTPSGVCEQAQTGLLEALDEAAYYWSPARDVRFVADVSIIDRWSEAKG